MLDIDELLRDRPFISETSVGRFGDDPLVHYVPFTVGEPDRPLETLIAPLIHRLMSVYEYSSVEAERADVVAFSSRITLPEDDDADDEADDDDLAAAISLSVTSNGRTAGASYTFDGSEFTVDQARPLTTVAKFVADFLAYHAYESPEDRRADIRAIQDALSAEPQLTPKEEAEAQRLFKQLEDDLADDGVRWLTHGESDPEDD